MTDEERAKASLLLAALLQHAGRPEEAIGVLRQAAKDYPRDAQVGHRLALLYARTGAFQEAAAECERLVALDSRALVPLDLLAALYVRLGEKEKLWPVVRRLLELCPDEPRYRLLKAMLLQQAGDTPGAMDEYLAVLEQEEDDLSTQAAEEAVYYLDMVQIQRLLAVAQNDPRLRARMRRDLHGVLREWRVRLSEAAQAWLEGFDLDALTDRPEAGAAEPLH